jgi:diamine N-acetyltransferase
MLSRTSQATEVAAPPPTVASGRWVRLRPVSVEDYQSYYDWRLDLQEFGIWKGRRIVTQSEFARELASIVEGSQLLTIVERRTLTPIGFVQVYDHSQEDGWAFFTAYLTPAYRTKGHGAEASLLFGEYLFTYYPIRKVYADVLEFNENSLRSLEGAGFEVEGRRKAHAYLQGRYWDLIHLALTRESWDKLRGRRLTQFVQIGERE